MKKLSLLLLCLLLPMGVFALDFMAGANAYYAGLIQPEDVEAVGEIDLTIADFAFGGEARLVAGPLWGSAVGVYMPGDEFLPDRIHMMIDGGVAVKLLFLRFGAGLGPDFGFYLGNPVGSVARAGANLRLTGDILLGNLSLGLSWVSHVEFTRESIVEALQNPYGFLGVTALLRF